MTSGILLASGGLGLFLLGMVVMTGGLKSLAGDALRRALARFTKSPFSGAVTGAVTTAIIQSSSATTVAAVGFVGAGLLTFSQALGILFGANIGTTITGWLVAILGFKLKIGELAMPLILVGILVHLFTKRSASSVGLALAGFGLIFVGIESLQKGLAGLEGMVTPDSFPGDTMGGRVLLVLIGMAVTVVMQSSSAGVAMALAAVSAGAISFPQAAAMVVGMDVGTTATAAMATIGASTDARRTGFSHVIYNIITGVGAFFLLTPYVWFCSVIFPGCLQTNPEIALVAFHSLFNTLGVIIALPFTAAFARLIMRIVPGEPVKYTQRLDRSLYESPAIALDAVDATLKELARVVFEQLLTGLEHEPSPESESILISASEALNRTRDYLQPIDTSARQKTLYPKHLSSIHTIDHLRRLIERCGEGDKARRARSEPDLVPLRDRLRLAVSEALVKFYQEGRDLPDAKTLKDVWEEFESQAESHRHHLIGNAVRGRLDADATIGKLDALRWLQRVAYHVWRIDHHLRHSQSEEEIDSADDVSPHPQPGSHRD